MMEDNYKDNSEIDAQPAKKHPGDGFDAAGKSLSEALRVSFIILKIIMIVLIVLFLVSGFETVGSDEEAIVLRFGKIRGIGENRILGPGLHWVFPYPIDEIVKIPVKKKPILNIKSFWYYQRPSELLPEGPKNKPRIPASLNPIKDGYCITRSERQSNATTGFAGSDYNIVHSKWQLIYSIDDLERFFRNVYVKAVKPGQNYFDVITESITPLLKNLVSDTIVTAMVDYTIDEALLSTDRMPKHIERLLQEKLNETESGIRVVSVNLTAITWPRQVDYAFNAFIAASQSSEGAVSKAKGYAENTLNEAAGPIASELHAAFKDETVGEQEKELLWSHVAGAAGEKIAQARAYRTTVVETAKANADYLQKLLPEYRKRPKLVIQKIYQDAIEYVLNNADEKMIIQPAEGTKGREIRILLNRDPTIKSKSDEEEK